MQAAQQTDQDVQTLWLLKYVKTITRQTLVVPFLTCDDHQPSHKITKSLYELRRIQTEEFGEDKSKESL